MCFPAIGAAKDPPLSTLSEVSSATCVYYTAARIVRFLRPEITEPFDLTKNIVIGMEERVANV